MDVSVYVAAHKRENLVLPEGYRICQVNAEKTGRWEGSFVHDNDSDDNISAKNESYCELTALYELWRNDRSDIKGLAHYRRYFSRNNTLTLNNFLLTTIDGSRIRDSILKKEQIIGYLSSYDMIVEYPCNPEIANAYEDLLRYVYPQDIEILCKTIEEYYPDYEESLHCVLRSTRISYLNMFIAKREICDKYCEWLFGVLGRVEDRINTGNYDVRHRRVYGYFGEVLLNVWIMKNRPAVRYVFSMLVKPADEGKITLKGILRKSRYLRYIKAAYLRVFEKDYCKKSALRLKELEDVINGKPFSYTLDNIYCRLGSAEDALLFYSEYADKTVKESYTAGSDERSYACDLFEYDPEDIRGVNRCLATAFIDDIDQISCFINDARLKFSDKYTVNCRIVTEDPDVAEAARKLPETYVYFSDRF